MVNGGIIGPAGAPRPLASCNQQVAIVLEGRDSDIDIGKVESNIESELTNDVTVSTRGPRITGDKEVVVAVRSSVISEDTVETIISKTRQSLINQNTGYQVDTWRVES